MSMEAKPPFNKSKWYTIVFCYISSKPFSVDVCIIDEASKFIDTNIHMSNNKYINGEKSDRREEEEKRKREIWTTILRCQSVEIATETKEISKEIKNVQKKKIYKYMKTHHWTVPIWILLIENVWHCIFWDGILVYFHVKITWLIIICKVAFIRSHSHSHFDSFFFNFYTK